MDYEWTEWMDVPMGVPCPVRVGEIVEVEWRTSDLDGFKYVKVMDKSLQNRWTKRSSLAGTNVIFWKYRVKKPNTKKWLESLETHPEADLVKG